MDTLGCAGTGPIRLRKPTECGRRGRENSSSTLCTSPGMRPEGGNLEGGCPQASELGGACSTVNGGKLFSVITGEVLCSGRNTEDLRRNDMQDLSLRWFSQSRCGLGLCEPGLVKAGSWAHEGRARAAPAEPTSSQRAQGTEPSPLLGSALSELPVGGLILLVREEAAHDRPPLRQGGAAQGAGQTCPAG